jgi:methyltransferase NSUN6
VHFALQGMLIAIDKSAAKVNQITENARKLGLTNVAAYAFDSVKAVRLVSDQSSNTEPPFERESFDRILLDAPCSALGQRPQLYNAMRFKELQSFPRLQKKLFNAVKITASNLSIVIIFKCS